MLAVVWNQLIWLLQDLHIKKLHSQENNVLELHQQLWPCESLHHIFSLTVRPHLRLIHQGLLTRDLYHSMLCHPLDLNQWVLLYLFQDGLLRKIRLYLQVPFELWQDESKSWLRQFLSIICYQSHIPPWIKELLLQVLSKLSNPFKRVFALLLREQLFYLHKDLLLSKSSWDLSCLLMECIFKVHQQQAWSFRECFSHFLLLILHKLIPFLLKVLTIRQLLAKSSLPLPFSTFLW